MELLSGFVQDDIAEHAINLADAFCRDAGWVLGEEQMQDAVFVDAHDGFDVRCGILRHPGLGFYNGWVRCRIDVLGADGIEEWLDSIARTGFGIGLGHVWIFHWLDVFD